MIVAIFRMFGILLLIFIVVIVFFVLRIIQRMFGKDIGTRSGSQPGANPMFGRSDGSRRPIERCPSCQQTIMVGKEPDRCPKCQTPLGRNHEGKLLIRVN